MKLLCPLGHEYRTRHFERERDEVACPICGGFLVTPFQRRAEARARARGGRLREISPAESAAAQRFHNAVTIGNPCWGREHRSGHRCGGALEAHHLLPKEWIHRQLGSSLPLAELLEVKYSPRLGLSVCADLHGRIESRSEIVFFDEVPVATTEFVAVLDLEYPGRGFLGRLETESPPRMKESTYDHQSGTDKSGGG